MTSSEIKIVPKGWGYEKWIVNTDEYCGKLLHFIKGKKCSSVPISSLKLIE